MIGGGEPDPRIAELFGRIGTKSQPTTSLTFGGAQNAFSLDAPNGTRSTAAPTVQQTAQNPLTNQIGPVSPEIARAFQTQVGQDALRRGGFDDPRDVSPIKVSAPGTSKFLQDLSASVSGTLGFGSPELFMEMVRRLTPQGVRQGVARRTI